ncbi:RhuM family protein [Barnesiella intestinihominis]|uniref:virulence RhuM family protein n=1 Tax=Barnesiella intestinihominis TaxID=487174 RepID=UPI001897C5A1|nr:RhuM family protein [Barnesiella intestinihominis]MDB0682564.1 RhuM family protein [Barnesiella intestinihominis]
MEQKSEIVLYQPEGSVSLEVRLENETVWLTQQQISELFGTGRQAITKHLKNIFASNELDENSVCSILELTAADGKNYKTKVYNLDAILSIGYRVNSKNATLFRRWANSVLKEYMLKGYSINQKLDSLEKRIDNRLREHDSEIQRLSNQVDFFVRHSLPPIEGIFFAGQIFDAYKFVCDLVKSARKSIVLFDNYIDESVLTLFGKRGKSVSVVIYTDKITPQLELDIKRFNAQYPPVKVKLYTKAHDRFLIIDGEIYHIGASLKDLGKKLFAFSKISAIPPEIIYKQIDS